MQKNIQQLSFSSISRSKRKPKSQFFDQMELLLDVATIDSEIKKYYSKGFNVAGRPSYSGLFYLKSNGLKDGIMHKAVKNKPLSNYQVKFNKIGQVRFKVERIFGSITRWFKTGIARYVGKEKTHTQHLMEAIAYNLYRSPGYSYVQFKCISQITGN
ncbi:MAG: transposase [Sphingobacteriales bacterium]|nr:transposase [Sphingobacteriales bacterium]